MVTTAELQRRGLPYAVVVDGAATPASLADLDDKGLPYLVEVADGATMASRRALEARGLRYLVPVLVDATAASKGSLAAQGLRYAVQVDADILPADRAVLQRQGLACYVEVDSSGNSVAIAGGGTGLLLGEANGLATDFRHPVDGERVAVKTANVAVLSALDSFYSNAGTSPKQVYDATGTMVWSPHNMLLWCENFTVGNWVKTGTPIAAAHTIQDDDPAAFEYVQQQLTCIVGATYTATVWLTKDAVTSRFPAIGIAGTLSFITQINSSTGAKLDVTTTLAGSSVAVSDGTYWKLSVTFVADVTSMGLRIYPAHGTTFGATDVAAVGTITVDKTQFNRGSVSTAYLTNTTSLRNGLAIDYDPVTHACKGLLCEPAATNLILNNAAMSTQSVTVTAVAYTLSIFGTGTVTLTGVSTAGPLVGTGAANRVSLTFTPTAGSLTCTVSGSVTQAQLETGTVATSPILTGSASVTRAADGYFVLTSAFPFSATASTMIVDCTCTGIDTAGTSVPSTLSNNSSTDLLQFRLQAALVDGSARSSNVAQANPGFAATAGVGSHKLAFAAQLDDFRFARNGGLGTPDTSGAMPVGINRLDLGNSANSLTQSLKGYLRTITYVPRAMTNVEMQAKTT